MEGIIGKFEHFDEQKCNWENFIERLEISFTVNSVTENEKKIPVLLSLLGPETYRTLKNLLAPSKPSTQTYKKLVDTLTQHYSSKPTIVAERFRFFRRDQGANETMNSYMAELRRLASTCNFGTFLEEALRDRFVFGLHAEPVRKRLLSEVNLTLKSATEIALAMEIATKDDTELQYKKNNNGESLRKIEKSKVRNQNIKKCSHCGKSAHDKNLCKFQNDVCANCNKKGHIEAVCQSRQSSEKPKPQKGAKVHGSINPSFIQRRGKHLESGVASNITNGSSPTREGRGRPPIEVIEVVESEEGEVSDGETSEEEESYIQSTPTSESDSDSSQYSSDSEDESGNPQPPRADIEESLKRRKSSPWITDVIPRKSPYVPQMGDELIYLRQGHEQYVKFVVENKVYPIDPKQQPYQWLNIKENELVEVTGIQYKVGSPILCELKLAQIGPDTRRRTKSHFTIKYHAFDGVVDFLVLRQQFDQSVDRKWRVGDCFRTVINDVWLFGKIVDHEPFQNEYPLSHFQCFRVELDNGETKLMSPWDLESIDETEEEDGNVPITHDEWTNSELDTECQRIILCIEQVMDLDTAELFVAPVDLNEYPSYGFFVPYPTDLSTIKSRLETRFYRRLSALKWEVKLIGQNAAAFNPPETTVVKEAEIVTRLLLEIIRDTECWDARSLYSRMAFEECRSLLNVDRNTSEEDHEKCNKGETADSSPSAAEMKRSDICYNSKDWTGQCQELLEMMWNFPDSRPFRYPVDGRKYRDYNDIISTPMDISTIRHRLSSGSYQTPVQLGDDFRLIISNSKSYNTKKESKIYAMTFRLSRLFEDHFKSVVCGYKSALKCERQVKSRLERHNSRSSGSSFSCSFSSENLTSSNNNKQSLDKTCSSTQHLPQRVSVHKSKQDTPCTKRRIRSQRKRKRSNSSNSDTSVISCSSSESQEGSDTMGGTPDDENVAAAVRRSTQRHMASRKKTKVFHCEEK